MNERHLGRSRFVHSFRMIEQLKVTAVNTDAHLLMSYSSRRWDLSVVLVFVRLYCANEGK